VTLVEHLGHETLIHARVGETPVVARLDAIEDAPSVGDDVGLTFPERHLHLFDPVTSRRVEG
jgi:sn-glycerol 3-phosphate transport system ATP-binding protein